VKLSTRGRYGLRLILDVARNGSVRDPVSLTAVSKRIDVSRAYLEQVASALRAAGLLRGVSGRRGGYRLGAPATEITVGQVLQAAVGPICVVDCLADPVICPRSDACECRLVYGLINERINDVLDSYTLADLLAPGWLQESAARSAHGGRQSDPSYSCGCPPRPGTATHDQPNAKRSGA
jgi:Rrf2 family protein